MAMNNIASELDFTLRGDPPMSQNIAQAAGNNAAQAAGNIQSAFAPAGLGQGLHGLQQNVPNRPDCADTVASHKQRLAAKVKVLEFIESQLRMNLFNDDLVAKLIFDDAMDAATKRITT
jgi:hypothetical protein